MPTTPEHRKGQDRREKPRGGRRTDDSGDLAPLILLIGDEPVVMNLAETVLAKLRFAVTTSSTADDALRVLVGLRPDLVVARAKDAERVRKEAPEHLSVVILTDEMRKDPEALIPAIRQALRAGRAS